MPLFDPFEVAKGDSLRYTLPISGDSMKVDVHAVRSQSPEGVSVYTDLMKREVAGRITIYPCFLRHIATPWVTHRNGLRIMGRQAPRQESRLPTEAPESSATQLTLTSGEEADMAKKPRTTTRKSLDEMSVAHREHIEKWEPHLEMLRGEHVWAAVSRVPGRGVEGPVYIALKRGAKDYVIVDYDTAKKTPVTPKRTLADGFETSSSLMEAFKKYRQMAKTERTAARDDGKKPAAKKAKVKAKAKTKATAKRVRKPKR